MESLNVHPFGINTLLTTQQAIPCLVCYPAVQLDSSGATATPSTYGSGLLGEEQRLMQGWATPKATADMIALLELFGTKIERSVIEDAYACCAHSFEPTLQFLVSAGCSLCAMLATYFSICRVRTPRSRIAYVNSAAITGVVGPQTRIASFVVLWGVFCCVHPGQGLSMYTLLSLKQWLSPKSVSYSV
eukprot:290151-Pelagomonas_calceolata.AAC.1